MPEVLEGVATAARLRFAIGRLMRRLRGSSVSGLTPSQLSALSSIDRHQPVRLGDLATVEGISPSTLSPIVATLATAGLVQRQPDPDDGRSALVVVSRQGSELIEQLRAEAARMLSERLAGLTDDERAVLDAAIPLLERLAED